MRNVLVLVASMVLSACATAPTPPPRELTVAGAQDVVRVAPGQVLVVPLSANPSTGFTWVWDEGAAAGVLVQDGEPSMSAPDPERIGSGGTQTWRFRAVKPGDATLRLDYRRAWEADQPAAQTLRWRIEVR